MTKLQWIKDRVSQEKGLKNIPEELINSMLELQFTNEFDYPVALSIQKSGEAYSVSTDGVEFVLEYYDPEDDPFFDENVDEYDYEDDEKMQVSRWEFNNEPLEKFCLQYINTAKDQNKAARELLEAQYYILDRMYMDGPEGSTNSMESAASYFYAFFNQRKHTQINCGRELYKKLWLNARWFIDELYDLNESWEDYDVTISPYFI